jgi:hypothetical protein
MITDREFEVLKAICRYYVLNSRQIQRLFFPDDASGRVTRRRLQLLVTERLLNRQQMRYAHPSSGSIGPVYYPAQKGCDLLADHFDDERYRRTPTKPPISHHVWHWLAVAETHMALDAAIAKQNTVKLRGWINEYDELEGDDRKPEKRFRLYTLIQEAPRLVCVPDAAFMLSMKGHAKVFYLEQDRATSGTKQIAASKTPGYAALADQMLHRRHFPDTTIETFTVLMVTPGASRRDSLRRAIREKPGAKYWRFATVDDLTTDAILHNKIWYPADDGPAGALIRGESS